MATETRDYLNDVGSSSPARWVMSFVSESDEMRKEFLDKWEESLANYIVQPFSESSWYGRTDWPLRTSSFSPVANGVLGEIARRAILKDPESHQVVESILASLWTSLFGVPGYMQAVGVGQEDVEKGIVATKYLEFVFGMPGHPRTFYEWLKDGLIFGTGTIRVGYDYAEGYKSARSVSSVFGVELTNETTEHTAIRDDPKLSIVDISNFFPSPGCPRIEDTCASGTGVAERFEITAYAAKQNLNWDQTAVDSAIRRSQTSDTSTEENKAWRRGYDRPQNDQPHPSFHPMVGYRYHGVRPWVKSGDQRGMVTVLCGEVVEEREWWLYDDRPPYYTFTVNPISGRFYGISPIEVNRYCQDFADALLMNLADGVARATHPPHIVDRNKQVTLDRLRRWKPDVPVIANSVDAVMQLPYNPPLGPAFSLFGQLKNMIRESSGALSAIQGMGIGVDRASATEAQATFQRAGARIEMMAELIEQNDLPPLARCVLGLGQKFLNTEGLIERIGTDVPNANLSDILLTKDVKFVGSRLVHNKRARLENVERFVAVWSKTPVANLVPWNELLKLHAKLLEVPELVAAVGDPSQVLMNQVLQMMQAQANPTAQSAANGSQAALPPTGMNPAQAAGGPSE